MKFFSHAMISGAMFIAFTAIPARAAELVMFERAGCPWCEVFDREISPIYDKTDEGKRAPLRRVNIDQAVPDDLAFVDIDRLTPLFVLVDGGKEIGRIRGYPGEDYFWGLLDVLLVRLNAVGTSGERADLFRKPLHVTD
jgi:hypothetical protein